MKYNKAFIFSVAIVSSFIITARVTATEPESIHLNDGIDNINITKIDDGVYLVVHYYNKNAPCNSLLVKLPNNNFIWCGTPCNPYATRVVYEWICKNFGEPNLVEINTGFHEDNLGGNEFLLAKSVPVYGSDLTAKLIRDRGLQEKERILRSYKEKGDTGRYDLYKGITFQPPNHTFEIAKGLTLNIADEIIEVYYPGPSHAPDNVVVYFSKRRILHGGCMIKALSAVTAGYTADADVKQWPNSVQRVLEKYNNARIVVPGHGEYGDISLVKYTIKLIRKVNGEKSE